MAVLPCLAQTPSLVERHNTLLSGVWLRGNREPANQGVGSSLGRSTYAHENPSMDQGFVNIAAL